MDRRIVKILCRIPIFLLIIFALVNFLFTVKWMYATANNQSPTLAGFTVTVVVSGSMEPTIPTKSLVITQTQDTYQVGDIVLYKSMLDDRYILHRIIDSTSDGFVLKGDANSVPDSLLVSQDQIVGKVIFFNYYLGVFRVILSTPIGALCVTALCYFLFMVGLHKLEEVSDESYSKITDRHS